jgi:hypothetical protein
VVTLSMGSHSTPEHGTCLFEAYNLARFNAWRGDDRPHDVSFVLFRYGLELNDALPDGKRQALTRFLPSDGSDPLAGTADDGLDDVRGYLGLDWMVRTCTPAWLDAAGLTAEAAALRGLPEVTGLDTAQAAIPALNAAVQAADVSVSGKEFPYEPYASEAVNGCGASAVDAAVSTPPEGGGLVDTGRWIESWRATWDAVWAAAQATARADEAKIQAVVDGLQDSAVDLLTRMVRPVRGGS